MINIAVPPGVMVTYLQPTFDRDITFFTDIFAYSQLCLQTTFDSVTKMIFLKQITIMSSQLENVQWYEQ